ncbi:MAG TPA: MBL fold metallo-hydrolase [Candidatus Paceibacterota bacterium]|nr:MBL fold metallo-hydrolase [Candidatus Paceibacterota bacterium]
MKIKKIGHCCLVLETGGKKIMTDPGSYTPAAESETGIDIVLITHEHGDHFHVESLKKILAANPQVVVVTNSAVGKLLRAENIPFTQVEDSESESVNGILIEGFGTTHALVYDSIPSVMNTGYFVDNSFYFPGDAFYNPGKEVQVLALPMAGPWLKLSEALDYLKLVRPTVAFNVHDGMIIPASSGFLAHLGQMAGQEDGTKFVYMGNGDIAEF